MFYSDPQLGHVMTPVEGATAIGKFTEAVKDLPTWLFLAFAAAAGILRFVPIVSAELPETYRPWLVVFLVVFGMLALLKWIFSIPSAWRIAQINRTDRPCAIICSDGPHGDEFIAMRISLADARIFAAMGIANHLPESIAHDPH